MIPNGEPKILLEGTLGAMVSFPMLVDMGKGHVEKNFERFVRPPGTRIIALKDNKIYLQKEYRSEINKYDWRLPGGKVVDSFIEYKDYIGKEMPETIIIEAGRRELQEEAKLDAKKLTIFKKSPCGASVEWDLYYIIAEDVLDHHNNHNEGEEIVDGKWFDFEKVLDMCNSGEIDEDRTVATLHKYIRKVTH
jgi:8-oxo-dGTP pyrophosphatase MutT (NUDIX family)